MGKSEWEGERWVEGSSGRIQLKALTSMEEMSPIVALQQEVWGYGLPDSDLPYPARCLFAFAESGGLVASVFIEKQPVGFGFAWIGKDRQSGKSYLNSQLVGILPQYRHLGLGYHIKTYQRDFALHFSLNLVKWTFDPLQGANANLNLRKLGAVATTLRRNYYGQLESRFSGGLATDRLLVEWYIHSARTLERLRLVPPPLLESPRLPQVTQLETIHIEGAPLKRLAGYDLELSQPELLVEIPDAFEAICETDLTLARDWQEKIRNILEHYLGQGYLINDFLIVQGTPRRAFYLLSRSSLDEVLETTSTSSSP